MDRSAEEVKEGKRREDSELRGEGAEVLDGTEAVGVKGVVDVLSEVGADAVGGDGDAGCPLADESFDVGETGVAAGSEVGSELPGCDAVEAKSCGADGPDGSDPGKAGVLTPEGSEVEPQERAGPEVGVALAGTLAGELGFDLRAVLAGEERGVADEERCVGGGEHGDGVGALLSEGGAGVVEVFEENVRVGGGAARRGVRRDGGDVRESFADGKVRGIFDKKENAADFALRGDGTAGNDGELGREFGDWDKAEIGGAGVELACAVCGRGVVELVVAAESGGCGLVLEVK